MADLTSKTALVTGASRGIGRAIAIRLASDGAKVGVHYGSNETAAKDVVTAIQRSGGKAFSLAAEMGTGGDVEALFRGLEHGLNGDPLDILVNNAGILDVTPFEQVTPDAFHRSVDVNVRAPFFIIQRLLPLLRDGGRVINITSASTRIAGSFVHYAVTKGAVEVLSRTLAQALGPRGITVNAVSPGVINTDMAGWMDDAPQIRAAVRSTIAHGRIGEPEDVADVVAFLASPDARWVTGESIDASGGQWLGPQAA